MVHIGAGCFQNILYHTIATDMGIDEPKVVLDLTAFALRESMADVQVVHASLMASQQQQFPDSACT